MADQVTDVLTIGNFDGVHLGHAAILDAASGAGGAGTASRVTVLTFEPHPVSVLRPAEQPPRLMTRLQKERGLKAAGADRVVVLEPRRDLLSMGPEDFVRWVADEYRPSVIVEGPDFRFGKHRAGDTRTLRALGRGAGFEVRVVDPVEVELSDQLVVPVSSSLVRWLIGRGRVADAALCLGHPYELCGVVGPGEGRGRAMGVPTLNLQGDGHPGCLVPADGVYAGVGVLGDGSSHPAAISVGRRETFGGGPSVVEVHLLGYDGDLYGREVAVRFGRWVRDQQAFPTADMLRAQIGRDVRLIRGWSEAGWLAGQPGMIV